MALSIEELARLNGLIDQGQYGDVERAIDSWLSDYDTESLHALLSANSGLGDGILNCVLNLLKSAYQLSDNLFTSLALNKHFLASVQRYSQSNTDAIINALGLLGKQNYSELEIKQLLALITLESVVDIPWPGLFKGAAQYTSIAYVGLCRGITPSENERVKRNIEALAASANAAALLQAGSVADLALIAGVLRTCQLANNLSTQPIEHWATRIIQNFSQAFGGTVDQTKENDDAIVFYASLENPNDTEQALDALLAISGNVHIVAAHTTLPESLLNKAASFSSLDQDLASAINLVASKSPGLIVFESITDSALSACLSSVRIASKQVVLEDNPGLINFANIDLFTHLSDLDQLESRLRLLGDKLSLSICIPTLNRAAKLQANLEKLSQIRSLDLEVNISDNHSSDETGEMVAQYKNAFKVLNYVKHDAQLDIHDNFKFVLSMAQCENVFLLPDDDFLNEQEMVNSIRLLQKNQSLKAVFGGFQKLDPNGTVLEVLSRDKELTVYSRQTGHHLVRKNVSLDLPLIRKEAVRHIVNSPKEVTAMGWDFISKLLINGDVAVIPGYLFSHVEHDDQYTLKKSASETIHMRRLRSVNRFLSRMTCTPKERLDSFHLYQEVYCRFLCWLHSKTQNFAGLKEAIEVGLVFNYPHFVNLAKSWNEGTIWALIAEKINDQLKQTGLTSAIAREGCELTQPEKDVLKRYGVPLFEANSGGSGQALYLSRNDSESDKDHEININNLMDQHMIYVVT